MYTVLCNMAVGPLLWGACTTNGRGEIVSTGTVTVCILSLNISGLIVLLRFLLERPHCVCSRLGLWMRHCVSALKRIRRAICKREGRYLARKHARNRRGRSSGAT